MTCSGRVWNALGVMRKIFFLNKLPPFSAVYFFVSHFLFRPFLPFSFFSSFLSSFFSCSQLRKSCHYIFFPSVSAVVIQGGRLGSGVHNGCKAHLQAVTHAILTVKIPVDANQQSFFPGFVFHLFIYLFVCVCM